MGLGVLEDTKLQHVPGTSTVLDDESRLVAEAGVPASALKHDKSGRYILVPQPSDDPNDPLNWPLWKRDFILFILSLLSVIASTLSSLMAANTLTISLYMGRNFTQIALLTGYHLLGVGVAGFLFVPSARIWGKRHLFILGNIILIFSSAWGGASNKHYASLLWARIFQGIGLAPFEALVNASVGDLYYVHERGKRMAISNVALFGGAFFTPVIVGKMTSTLGWQWSFYFVAIFSGVFLPLVIFLVPETAYRRDATLNTDTAIKDNDAVVNMNGTEETPRDSGTSNDGAEKSAMEDQGAITQSEKVGYWKSLMPFNGRKTDDRYLNLLFRPLPLFLHPGVLWACLIQGTLIGWTVMIGILIAAVGLLPPLFFTEVETGYMYSGPFVGAVLGFIVSGLLSDWSAALLTRWNNGIYEPEFRLVLIIPQLIFGVTGLVGFGYATANIPKFRWFWPSFFFGSEVMGMVIGAVASALYIVDAHRDIAIEAFTCMMVFKNFFSFGLTFSGYDWMVHTKDVKQPFIIIGIVQAIICLLSVPMYVLGKKNRSFIARHDVFFKVSDFIANALYAPFTRSKSSPKSEQHLQPAASAPAVVAEEEA